MPELKLFGLVVPILLSLIVYPISMHIRQVQTVDLQFPPSILFIGLSTIFRQQQSMLEINVFHFVKIPIFLCPGTQRKQIVQPFFSYRLEHLFHIHWNKGVAYTKNIYLFRQHSEFVVNMICLRLPWPWGGSGMFCFFLTLWGTWQRLQSNASWETKGIDDRGTLLNIWNLLGHKGGHGSYRHSLWASSIYCFGKRKKYRRLHFDLSFYALLLKQQAFFFFIL